MEGERVGEVLYESRCHARGGPVSCSSSSHLEQEQINTGAKGGLLSFLSVRGINQLREKWKDYKRPRTLRKNMSLFISPGGEHVAVAAENQITILQKDDNYMNPCGIFISNHRQTIFTHGAWSEPQGILGIIDDVNTLYFIKSDGQELTRTTANQLKLSGPIVDLIVHDDLIAKHSFLCGFCIFTTDGLLHHIEVTQEPSACIYSMSTPSNNHLRLKGQCPQYVSCLDFRADLSLVVLVGADGVSANCLHNSGSYSLSLWRITGTLELELLFCSPHFEGLFSAPKGYIGSFTTPKVIISPQGKYLAALDLTGCLDIFNLNGKLLSLSMISLEKRQYSQMSDNLDARSRNCLKDTVDVTWWSDQILILAKRSGIVTMFDVISGMKLLENDPVFCMPVLERISCCEGYVFILEGTSSKERPILPEHKANTKMPDFGQATDEKCNQPHDDRLYWSLLSFSEKSVSEMYTILINRQQYQAALDFANRHGLDKDEILKSQWLHSDQGTKEINLFLSNIKDQKFVLSECVNKVGPTEAAVKALLSYGLRITDQYKFSNSEDDNNSLVWNFRMIRLQLLQCRDRLETFVGINMGRFSVQEYRKFRVAPLNETAMILAESGKIGALNLLFKRHPYSLACSALEILAAIPETVPIQSYAQLLLGRCPPSTISVREGDWVECEKMACFINKLPSSSEDGIEVRTEIILKQCMGLVWPSVDELSEWYRNRARDIDNLTGLLDNCLSLVDFACRKGIVELQQFLEDILYLHQLIYSNDEEINFTMSFVTWEQLSDYEKFGIMLKGVKEDKVVTRLREKAIPFMQSRSGHRASVSEHQMRKDQHVVNCENTDSFLVRWLKEIAAKNKIDICLAIIEDGCKDFLHDCMFKDEVEAVETALDCIYLCTLTDRWNTMASILSKLPRKNQKEKASLAEKDFSPSPRFSHRSDQIEISETQTILTSLNKENSASQNPGEYADDTNASVTEFLEKKVRTAEGHVEVGRLLAYYQVPKPMSFFQGAHLDEKNVKQLLRLILSKFGRRQPGRSDNDWATMWRDMQCFQEKAFPFLDVEFMLMEFCRGLLKAGKFSLARNYLKGTCTIALTTEKAENLVIQAAREYFFSASSLDCTEIWKAKECLSLFPNSSSVKAEADIIDALTIKLPNLGVTLLPMQFRQIRNPMEIINTVITSQTGAYLDVDELIEIAKLLGLSSQDDIAAIQEAVAREAAVTGDLQLAFDLCLVLAKKGHGPIWDLCAAIARGPVLDNIDISSRKQLLGFALCHCDEESIGELLHAWKDIDMQIHCEKLMTLTGTNPPTFSVQGSSIISLPAHGVEDIVGLRASSELAEGSICQSADDDQEIHFRNIKNILSTIGKDLPTENGATWDNSLRENGKFLFFSALQLPGLIEVSKKVEYGKNAISSTKTTSGFWYMSPRMQAVVCILSWLARNDIAPSDDLIASLAKSVMDPPATEEEDVLGCSFLLNLMDAFHGVEIIEEQLRKREGYQEVYSIMNLGMTYSSLHSSGIECSSPSQRRMLLLQKFQERHASFSSDEMDKIDKVQSTFWREWKSKLEEQKRSADQARELERIIPGVESARFLYGDIKYIESVVFSFVDSIKLEKKHILKEAIKLADTYGLHRTEVLLRYLGCALVSEHWTNDDILTEISEFKEDIVTCAKGVISMIYSVVYPEIEGHNKQRLSYIYSILSACYLRLKRTEEPTLAMNQDPGHAHNLELYQFYKLLEQECRKISFIRDLNFKNIATLDDLNFEHFNEEVCNHINESTVEALAEMVRTLVGIYKDSQSKRLTTWQYVYKHHVLSQLKTLESRSTPKFHDANPDDFQAFIGELEQNYESCRIYIRVLSEEDMLFIIGRYYILCLPCNYSESLPDESSWKSCLIGVLNLWIKLADDIHETLCIESNERKTISFNSDGLSDCLKVFKKLVMADEVLTNQGWSTVSCYIKLGLVNGLTIDVSSFCRAMVFSGCRFRGIDEVFSKGEASSPNSIQNLLQLYVNMTDSVLLDLGSGSGDRQNLHSLLSSLSKLDCSNIDDLRMVRYGVWGRLSAFSDNLQLHSYIRVYALELMQSVTGRNLRSLPVELVSDIEPWEGWDESCFSENSGASGQADVSSRVTSTLVALKSTQLVATISPSFKITSEDLMTIDSAVSCFFRLSETAHLDTLRAILEEWEELFTKSTDQVNTGELLEEGNNWSSDEWDDGWENLPEEPAKKEIKNDEPDSIHPLHTCWVDIIKRLIGLSQLADVTQLIDRSLSKSHGILLSEDEARSLLEIVSQIDCFMGLKIMLLLPYRALWFQSLSIVEANLKHGTIHGTSADYELLTLIMSSGVLPAISTDPAYCKVFSHFCFSVGHLSRVCQEGMLKHGEGERSRGNGDGSSLFSRVLFPCFVSELVKAQQYLLAGYIVSQWMHTHASLSFINVVEASLRRYLEVQLQKQQSTDAVLEEMDSNILVHTVSNLRCKLGSLLQSALTALPSV